VVQVKDFMGRIEKENDKSGRVFYDGPLAVLTSWASASASEIFSAAIQDYKRGLIVGEQTFGKGTVQQLIGLQRYLPGEKEKLGQLKLTMAKYYRINGGSTQNIGVSPDLQLPSAFDSEEFGESAYPSALPWDKIPPSEYEETNNISVELLQALSRQFKGRMLTDQDLQGLIEDIEEVKRNRQVKVVSLNEAERRAKQQADEDKRKAHDILNDQVVNSETGMTGLTKLKLKDQYLQEGLLILADLVAFNDA
jgi:carboxyl-terminal processing protease